MKGLACELGPRPGDAMTAAPHNPTIHLTRTPTAEDFAAIFQPLDRETALVTGPCRIDPLALLLRGDDGEIIGGLWGRIVYSWLVIEMLFVPATHRGMGAGTALIHAAEDAAILAGCVGLQLTKLDFQAPGFYERLGFSTLAVQTDVPPGHRCFHLIKRLDAAS